MNINIMCYVLKFILRFVYLFQFYTLMFLFPNIVNGLYLVIMVEVRY